MVNRRVALLALPCSALLALSACAGAPADSAAVPGATSQPAPSSAAASSPAPETPAPETDTAVPAPAPSPEKPSASGMATDRLADAVLDQLKIDGPDAFTDQLITIALSPLMRQFASTADVTTRVASKGPKVTLTLSGDDGTCVITVTDEPRARGVACKQV